VGAGSRRLASRAPDRPGTGAALDLCAAPGGKTMQLASAGWAVTAIDASESRLARLSENLERTGLSADIVIAADLLSWKPKAPGRCVLLDAPCTATGIFRRHPDVHPPCPAVAIAEMAALQAKLLARAADWVKPGGTLVYATCSLEPAEGEAQVATLLAARKDYRDRSGPCRRTARGHRAGQTKAGCAPCPACSCRTMAAATASSSRGSNEPPSGRLAGRYGHATGRHAASCPYRPFDPLRRFRAAGRGGARDRRRRRRLDPCRCDGRPFRAQHHDRPGRGEGAPPAHHQAARRPSDDRAGRCLSRRSPRRAPTSSASMSRPDRTRIAASSTSASSASAPASCSRRRRPAKALDYLLEEVDLVLVMSVNPGSAARVSSPVQLRKIESDPQDDRQGRADRRSRGRWRHRRRDRAARSRPVPTRWSPAPPTFRGGPTGYAANIAALRGG
jgi:SAM-dependent methyltransferase